MTRDPSRSKTTQRARMQHEDASLRSSSLKEPPVAPRKVLVVDVGGSHVKCLVSGVRKHRQFDSSPTMTAQQMVDEVLKLVEDWKYDAISVGYPGTVVNNVPSKEPHNLGCGWRGFNFERAFGCPAKVLNDSAMQALGAYHGGKMLFLGLGTGLGSAMIVNGTIVPMELAHLPYRKGHSYEHYVGKAGLERQGNKKWRKHVKEVVALLCAALLPDYVALGGGNSGKASGLPDNVKIITNEAAFIGGFKLWSGVTHKAGK